MMEKRTFVVLAENVNLRLDRFLQSHCPDLSRTRLQHLIAQGMVTSDSVPVFSSLKIKEGMIIEVLIPSLAGIQPQAQDIPLDILFEDTDLLVLNKSPGIVVHPAPGSTDQTIVNALLAHCGSNLSGLGGSDRPGIVHRLDKGTSGLMVVAKNDFSHQGLSQQFADRSLSRTYHALVWGVMNPLQGQITGNLSRCPYHRQKMALVLAPAGKAARTHYKTLRVFSKSYASLVECKLETGRTHQIRVHLTSQGHPLIGDPLYGHPPRSVPTPLIKVITQDLINHKPLLHAWRLEFIHPRSQEQQIFTVEAPQEFQNTLKILSDLK